MTVWDPNAPESLGLEWFPTESGARIINSSRKSAAMKLRSTAAESDLDFIGLYLPESLRRGVNNGSWWLEVYEEGDEVPGAVTTAIYRANAVDTNVSNAWVNQAAATLATGNVVAAISETALDTTTYAQYAGTYQEKAGLFLEFNTDSASGSPDGAGVWGSGRRVVGGRIRVVANRSEASGKVQFWHRPATGGNYIIGEINVDTELREFVIPFPEVYPALGTPWAIDYIQALDDDHSIRIKPIGIGKHKPLRIYQLSLELDYVTENRVALGTDPVFTDGDDWVLFDVLGDPTVPGPNWDKADATTYTLVLRRVPRWRNLGSSTDIEAGILDSGQVAWGYLGEVGDVGEALYRDPWLPDGFMASYSPALNADGTIAAMGEAGTRGYGLYITDPGIGGPSVDGQAYVEQSVAVPYLDVADYIGVGQTFTAGATDTYPILRFIVAVGRTDPTGVATYTPDVDLDDFEDLIIKIKVASTDAQIGASYILAPEDLADHIRVSLPPQGVAPSQGYLIEVRLTGISLTSGTQYYVEFTTDQDKDDDNKWFVLTGQTDDAVTPLVEPTYDSDTETSITTLNGTLDDTVDYEDLFLTLAQSPDVPADFAVTVVEDTLITDSQALTPDWLIHTLEYASLTWTGTSLAVDFVAYEIQRTHDGGDSWETIFWITDEAVVEARDFEARRNTDVAYRIRVHASWHASSEWSESETVVCEMSDCALLFVSNEDPTINQGYVDIGGERVWTFLTADERTTHTLVGRSYQVVTAPLEYRGDRFEVTLAVWAGSVPVDTGRARFDAFEALNSVATSYVCVLDETGRRWLADVTVSEGRRRGTREHTAEAKVIELTDVPSLVDVSSGA